MAHLSNLVLVLQGFVTNSALLCWFCRRNAAPRGGHDYFSHPFQLLATFQEYKPGEPAEAYQGFREPIRIEVYPRRNESFAPSSKIANLFFNGVQDGPLLF